MAFEVAQDKVAPESTTVSFYQVSRLGDLLSVRTGYAETRRSWIALPVTSAVDADADGVFETLHLAPNTFIENPTWLVGREVVKDDGVTVVGTIASTGYTDVVPGAHPTDPATPGYPTIVLTKGQGLPSAAAATLKTADLNFFGIQANKPSPSGRNWELSLSSDVPAQANRMQLMMGRVHFAVVKLAFLQAGITKTDAEIQNLVIAMSQSGNNIDSLIASEMELLEKDRRAGTLTSVLVMGQAPTV